ncbi:MAG: T9SS type A sorting domain-containing protein [Bacteroidota bacterium]
MRKTNRIYHNWILGLIILGLHSLQAQDFTPDAQIWRNTWASCSMSANPINTYGMSHWIQYDFGEVRRLSKTWVWNANEPSKLNQGFKSVKVDYSINGRDWTHWGEIDFPKGTGEAVYGGFPGPDMIDLEARYVLLTVVSTHGDPSCAGIAEIKFNLLPNKVGNPQYDNYICKDFAKEINHQVEGTVATISWTPAGNRDLYRVSYRKVVDGISQLAFTESPSLTLNNLEPNTEYEYFIGVECLEEDEFEWSEGRYFTTTLATSTQNPLNPQESVVRLTPNPTDGNFEVAYYASTPEQVSISILDVQGRTVYQSTAQLRSGPNVIPVQLSRQASGIYFLNALGERTQKKHSLKVLLIHPK